MIHQLTLKLNYKTYKENKEEIDKLLLAYDSPLDGYPFLVLTLHLDVMLPDKAELRPVYETDKPEPLIKELLREASVGETDKPEPLIKDNDYYEKHPWAKRIDSMILGKLADFLYRENNYHFLEDVGQHIPSLLSRKPDANLWFEVIA